MPSSFTHLHTHTEYSMLDGAARIDEVVAAAAADGQPALGITDHGNMYGVLDFYKACRSAGINPIIGTEAYMAAESRHERPNRRGQVDDGGGSTDGGHKLYYHLTLLAESTQGYKNLLKLSSRAYLEGYYYKPRVDWELLSEHSDGLIATTGCLGGVVLQALLAGDEELALTRAARLQEIFGRDNLFVELQDHGLPEQRQTNPQLIKIAEKIGAPLLATNDSHYTHREDAEAHDALLCVQTGAQLSDTNRFKFDGTEHYLKTAQEMRHLFKDHESACDSTLLIAERANIELELGQPSLPEFPVPEEITGATYEERASEYLRRLAYAGARERYGASLPDVVVERLDYELRVIADMGFPAYFLVVWDLIRYARESGIRVGPGRGSAAGCCVAYCLGIVDLDPIRYDLLFERFLNPGRKQMPDIDMDFDERYRGQMIKYAADRYGSDHVAQIVTFSTIKARAAVRDAARVLGYGYQDGDKVAKAMPPLIMGRDTPLAACFVEDPQHRDGFIAAADLRQMYDEDPVSKRIIDVARGLEGLRRGDGIHAAAVVISKDPLVEYMPIQRKAESGSDAHDAAPIVTQFEMHGVEELGLLKMDFLGLRNLSVIERCLDMIEQTSGQRPDIDRVDLDDDEVFAMLRRGDSIGVFQLESPNMRMLMKALAPTSFDDVAALVALYRPGPMAANMHHDYADRKNGRKPITYEHPDLEPILADTQGLMIYQESVMRVAQKFAGYSLEEADNLRKACGKKDRDLIAKEREKFVAGCERVGYGTELGTSLFDVIEPFADYAFNKSHSYGYGLVAYQTAWLKAHHPVEYLSALLTSVKDDKDKTAVYLTECRNLGIEVVVPDVNRSYSDFAPRVDETEEPGILFGLSAVRNVGENLVERIIDERSANGPFSDFFDFCRRVDTMVLNKRAIESLIKAGAFDSMGHPRQGLTLSAESIIDQTIDRRRQIDAGVSTLFAAAAEDAGVEDADWQGMDTTIPDVEFEKAARLSFEKEMLGLYVSDHPLKGVEGALKRWADCSISAVVSESGTGASEGSNYVTLAGVVSEFKVRYTKNGKQLGSLVLEDLDAAVEIIFFQKTVEQFGPLLETDAIVVVRCRIERRDDGTRLSGVEVQRPEITGTGLRELRVAVPMDADQGVIDRLKGALAENPGPSPVLIHIGDKVLRLPPELNVDPDRAAAEILTIFGSDALLAS